MIPVRVAWQFQSPGVGRRHELEKERGRRSKLDLEREVVEGPHSQRFELELTRIDPFPIRDVIEQIGEKRGAFLVRDSPPRVDKIMGGDQTAVAPSGRCPFGRRRLPAREIFFELSRQILLPKGLGIWEFNPVRVWMAAQVKGEPSLIRIHLIVGGECCHRL
jgi:hypothetical protein